MPLFLVHFFQLLWEDIKAWIVWGSNVYLDLSQHWWFTPTVAVLSVVGTKVGSWWIARGTSQRAHNVRALRTAHISDMGRHCDALVEHVAIYWSFQEVQFSPEAGLRAQLKIKLGLNRERAGHLSAQYIKDRALEVIIDHHLQMLGEYVEGVSERFQPERAEKAKKLLEECSNLIYAKGWQEPRRDCSIEHVQKCIGALQDFRLNWKENETTPLPQSQYIKGMLGETLGSALTKKKPPTNSV